MRLQSLNKTPEGRIESSGIRTEEVSRSEWASSVPKEAGNEIRLFLQVRSGQSGTLPCPLTKEESLESSSYYKSIHGTHFSGMHFYHHGSSQMSHSGP